jgi:two-component system, LytTR family, sensor kinase
MKYLKKNRVIIFMLRSYCCVVFSFLVTACYCQTPQPKFIALNGSRNYSDISTILPDSKNFLWFGCNQGLIRFDGSNYVRFAPDSSSKTIPSARITALHEDAKGIIWIGTADKGLFYYNYSTDKFTGEKNTINFFIDDIQDFKNEIAVTANKGLYIFNAHKNELLPLPVTETFKKNNITIVKCIADLKDKTTLWVLCSDGLYHYAGAALTKIHSYPYSVDELNNSLKTLSLASNGNVYSATKNTGLIEFSATDKKISVLPFSKKTGKAYSSNNIDALHFYDDGNLLIATQDSGLALFNVQQKTFHFLNQNNFPESDIFRFQATAFGSNKNNIVFATQSKGIWVYNNAAAGRFISVPVLSQHNKVPGSVYARSLLAVPEQNTVYVGSFFGDGLYVYNTLTGSTKSFPFIKNIPARKTLIITFILQDYSGTIWLASQENGLLVFDTQKQMIIPAGEKYTALFTLSSKKIFCIYEDKLHNLYIGTGGKGLVIVNEKRNAIQNYLHNSSNEKSILTDSIFAEKFFEDNAGNIWISTIKGISVFEPGTKQFYNFTDQPEKNNSIAKAFWYSTAQDNAGNIFIGTNDGLYKIKPGEKTLANAKHLTDKDGLLHNNIYSMVKDKKGLLWITCRNGISCYNTLTEKFANFTYKNGLPSKTLMSPMQMGADGNIYHGAVEKFFYFNTDSLLTKKTGPEVWFTGLKIFDKDSLPGLELNTIEKLNLDYKQHSFSFSFTSPDFFYADDATYSYMLEGEDRDWKIAGNRNYATYTNLQPGNYTFKVKAIGQDGEWSKNIRSLPIIITAPFWQRRWFILLYVLTVLAAVYFFIKRREKIIKRREAEKTEIEKLKAVNYQYQLEIEQVTNYFASAISGQTTVDDMLWDVTKNCISKMGFEDCVIYLADEERKILIQKSAWGPKTTEEKKIINPLKIPFGKGIVGSVALNNKAEIINDTSKDKRYIVDDVRRLSEISVPISNDGKVLGVIDSEHSQKKFYTERHLQILTTIASLVANRIVIIKAEEMTKQKEIEVLKLKASNFQYQLEIEQVINYFATSISGQYSIDEMLWDVSKNLIGKLGFEDCMIYLWNEDKTLLMQRAGHGLKGDMQVEKNKNVYHVPKGKGIVGAAAESSVSILVNDTSKDQRYFSADEKIMFSELSVPIIHNNETIGVINTEHSKKNFFTQRHLQILTTIASLCADKIDKINAELQTREKEVEVFKLNKDLATSQLTALRAQMNPHFIFNALNSVQQYILTGDVDQANKYLSKFSRLQREVLNHCDQNFISLDKEIEMLNLYLELEQLRFNENFEYLINLTDEIDSSEIKIPPMILQPFVENAIWHGLMPKQGLRQVSISFTLTSYNYLQCTIKDNGIGRDAASIIKEQSGNTANHKSKGLGLVFERLKILQQQYQQPFTVNITDLTAPNGAVQGTQVTLILYVGH